MFPDSFLYKTSCFHIVSHPLLGHYSNQEPIMFPNPLQIKASWAHHFPRDGRCNPPTNTRICPTWRFGEEIFCSVSGWWHAPSGHNAPRHGLDEHLGRWFTTRWMNVPEPEKKRPPGEQQLLCQGWKPTEKRTKKGNESPGNSIQIANSPKTKKMLNRKNDDLLGNPWCHPLFFFWGGSKRLEVESHVRTEKRQDAFKNDSHNIKSYKMAKQTNK